MTNAEWIRTLVDLNPGTEEMAQVISGDRQKCRFCSQVLGCYDVPGPCVEHIEMWLKQSSPASYQQVADLDAFASAQELKEARAR